MNAANSRSASIMTTAEVLRKRSKYLRMTDNDGKLLRRAGPKLVQRVREKIDELYVHLSENDHLSHLLVNPVVVRRLKDAQIRYYEQMMEGRYDTQYLDQRIKIGVIHEKVGLDPEYYLGAYAYVMTEMIPVLVKELKLSPDELIETTQALIRVMFFDISAAIGTYIERREATAFAAAEVLDQHVNKLRKTTEEISGATAAQSDGVLRQSSAVAQVATAVSELSQTARQALSQAESVMQATEHTMGMAAEGKRATAEVEQGMAGIRSQMDAVSARIQHLNDQTHKIGTIITSVSKISERSELLSLNAAIEAARAGEHGRGFAAVATAIRNLADQSQKSTKQVRELLKEIEMATEAAVSAVQEGTEAVNTGASLASVAGQRFNDLADAVADSGEAAKLIASVSRQQGEGIQQIATAMEEISQSSAQSADGMRIIDKETKGLVGLTQDISSTVDVLRSHESQNREAA